MVNARRSRRSTATREAWFEGARAILATDGYGALKLAPLCRYLGVTTGSFYHHFDSWQDFTDSLLDSWVKERTQHAVAVARRTEDPAQRLVMLAQASDGQLDRTEAAMRVWSGVDERVAALQRRLDDYRYQVVHEAMSRAVGSARAERYALWGLSTLVGFEMLGGESGVQGLLWSLQQILATADQDGPETPGPVIS